MFRHFVGNIFVFDAPPQEELPYVDIPAINPSETTASSLLINLSPENIPAFLAGKVDNLLNQKYLPRDILIRNSGIEPEYLLDTAKYLFELNVRDIDKFVWSSKPQYEDILLTSKVIWEKLGGVAAAKQSSMHSAKMMTWWVWELYKSQNVPRFRRRMIDSQINNERKAIAPDDAVENVLSFIRGWASFNYPKYLIALNELTNHVLISRGLKPCNYIPFAATIEHLFQPSSFSALEEYGLPTEISEKLLNGRLFSKDDGLDVVVNNLRNKELSRFANGVFERRVIEDFQKGIGSKDG
jgi:hypothetical protein